MPPDDDPGFELIVPEDFLPARALPADASRMGFDRNSEGGALIALAASLDPAKPLHRLVAWVMLLVFVAPTLLTLLVEVV